MVNIKINDDGSVDQINIVDEPFNIFDVLKNSTSVNVQDEALYVCDLTDIIRKHRTWTHLLPRVIPFYAVKCNDQPMVLQLLAALGANFDCASKGEIQKVLDMGVQSERIIFANPTKPASHLKYAAASNVQKMTFDGEIELYKIQKLAPNAELVLRIRCDAKVAQCPLGEKYGCDPIQEAPLLLDIAQRLGLNVIGISFHVGSGCMDPPVYERAIHTAKQLFDYAETLGYHFTFLDIGGGFPGDKGTSLIELSNIINSAIDQYFSTHNDLTIIAEPGRYYVSSAYTLACRIHSKREVCRNGELQNMMYFINDGVYGSFNCTLYDHKIAIPTPLKTYKGGLFRSTIWGPTCDALDNVCDNIMLPNMQIDDVIIFENMGAYTMPVASPFNGFPLPTIEYFIDRSLASYFDESILVESAPTPTPAAIEQRMPTPMVQQITAKA